MDIYRILILVVCLIVLVGFAIVEIKHTREIFKARTLLESIINDPDSKTKNAEITIRVVNNCTKKKGEKS